jgi:single-stranded-DNA-specific exonuclease
MKWVLAAHDAEAVSRLSRQADIHPLIARLMVARGITEAPAAHSFLSNDLSSLSDPGVLSGIAEAVSRIRAAVSSHEKIVIYGDYDVDGVTGSAVLFLALRELGANVGHYIPDRMTEGYGVNSAALQRIREDGAGLVITVDCGIGALAEAGYARERGLDLIITDHHECAAVKGNGSAPDPSRLPVAVAVIHPSLLSPGLPRGLGESVGSLTGVGVAFKLAQALLEAGPNDQRLTRYLDLVALGTVADMGRITGENRILVRQGLALLSGETGSLRPGIAALKQVAGIAGKRVTVGTVGFSLAPRINASGRIASADTAFRLLVTDDRAEALRLASLLDAVNRERQAVEETVWHDAREQCIREDLGSTGAFVLASEDWHPGVIGIVASRLADEFYRPTALIAVKDGVGRGSARSIPGFDLYQGLSQCSDLLVGYGGHTYAAGLTVEADRIPRLRERLNSVVRERIGQDGFVRTIRIDAPVTFDELTFDLMTSIERMAPFGQGNPEPRFGAKGIEVTSLRTVGVSGQHLKMRLRQRSGGFFTAIAYGKGGALGDLLRSGNRFAVVFTPRFNTWGDMTNIELEVRDVKQER